MSVTTTKFFQPTTGPYLDAGALPGDFYAFEDLLSDDQREIIERLREFLRNDVAPLVTDYWARAEFPHQIWEGFAATGIDDWLDPDASQPKHSNLMEGMIAMEVAHCDASVSTGFGVHTGLAAGTIIEAGSEEQKRRWLPAMSRFEKIGSFGLTEPHGGSDVAGGLVTTAQRDGDEWILNGGKRWIGNATFADINIIWARDVDSNHVLGFVVEKGTPGFIATKIENKIGLRMVQNADIVLEDCRVPDANHLENANSWRTTANVLRKTRAGVAWESVGIQIAAYETALEYAKQREQFGRPIGKFQMVQELLVQMLGNITGSLGVVVRLANLQDSGVYKDEHSALAKAFCCSRMRETVHWARELLGGNGIVIDYNIARFVGDSEAIYSYEGVREIQSLIVGKSVTDLSAFV
jgi:glutaryl-CoA dehydrogenase